MKKIWWLVALGLIAYLLFAITTLPASVIVSPLAKQGITASGVTGTLWRGAAQVVQSGNVNVGSVEWNVHVWSLLLARLTADTKLTRSDGFAQAEVTVRTGGRISLSNVSASLPLSTLPPAIAPRGWLGKFNVKLASLTLEKQWPTSAVGSVELLELVGPPRSPAPVGSYKLTFPEKPPGDVLAGALTDLSGPLQIEGTLQMKASDRSYVIDGLVATRPDASADLVKTLQFLGPPDAQGRRPLSLAGTM